MSVTMTHYVVYGTLFTATEEMIKAYYGTKEDLGFKLIDVNPMNDNRVVCGFILAEGDEYDGIDLKLIKSPTPSQKKQLFAAMDKCGFLVGVKFDPEIYVFTQFR
jgi:hypothetical protein